MIFYALKNNIIQNKKLFQLYLSKSKSVRCHVMESVIFSLYGINQVLGRQQDNKFIQNKNFKITLWIIHFWISIHTNKHSYIEQENFMEKYLSTKNAMEDKQPNYIK